MSVEPALHPPTIPPPAASGNAVGAPQGARPPGALSRTGGAVTEWFPRVQYRLARIGPAGIAGTAALLVAIGLLMSVLLPAQHSMHALSAQLVQAQHSAAAAAPQALPVDRFVAQLPTRAQVPLVLAMVLDQADKAQVSLDQGHYAYTAEHSGTLPRYTFEFPIKGSYPAIRAFVDGTLQKIPAAGLSKLTVERKNVADANVNATVGFTVYLRPE
jgi:hypothetical protein